MRRMIKIKKVYNLNRINRIKFSIKNYPMTIYIERIFILYNR